MSATGMNYFGGLREAKASGRLPYLEPDHHYKLKLLKTYIFDTQDKGSAFIAEFEIISTTSTQKPGTMVSWYRSMINKKVAWPALKELTYAVLGLDRNKPEDQAKILKDVDPVIEDELNKAVRENHMAGAVLEVKTVKRIAKEPPHQPYTYCNWLPA